MAGPYSKDLRGRVLAAMAAGESVEAAARRFAVGRSTAYRWVAAARDEGRREAKPVRGGPAPRIRGEIDAVMPDLAGGRHVWEWTGTPLGHGQTPPLGPDAPRAEGRLLALRPDLLRALLQPGVAPARGPPNRHLAHRT